MDSVNGALQYLNFHLGKQVYAMDIRCVREIIQVGVLTSVPLMPDCVRGVINLRGAVVPVIDLQSRLGQAPSRVGRKSCIILFSMQRDGAQHDIGLLVEAVSEVVEMTDDMLEPPPPFGTAMRRDFIRHMGRVGNRFVVVLDADRIFDIEDMAAIA